MENDENEPIIEYENAKEEQIPTQFVPDQALNEEFKQILNKKGALTPHHTCSRCKNDLGPVDQWFNFAVKLVKFGYTMIPQPLCKKCFFELESWLKEFESKDGTV